jgi:hypothetical protein
VAVTKEELRSFVGADTSADVECQSCLDVTKVLLDNYLAADAAPPLETAVPTALYDRAHLLAAAEMFNQGQAPNGVENQQFDDGGASGYRVGVPVRIGSDPLRPAYSLLQQYVLPAIGMA